MSGADTVRAAFALVRQVRGDLWPGFSPWATPLLVFDGTDTHLSAEPSEDGWKQEAGRWRWPGRHPALVASTAVQLPGDMLAAGVLMQEPLSPARLAAILVHEAFHVYQGHHPSPAWEADELAAVTAPPPDAATLHAHAEEVSALSRALQEPQDWPDQARRALAWRKVWAVRRPDALVQYIRGVEAIEGLAEYVECRFAGRWPELDAVRAAGLPTRARAYHSGAALARLLARTDPGWEAELLDGTFLDSLLARRLGEVPSSPPAADPRLQAAAQQAEEARRQQLLDAEQAFEQLPGSRLWLGAGWQVQGFDPTSIHVLPGGRTLHSRHLIARQGDACLTVVGAQVLASGGTLLAPDELQVRGLIVSAEPEPSGDRWHLRSGNVEVEAPRAWASALPDGWRLGP